ncbi:RAB7A-interacting MON1-CCZ1 complex subunit 1-like isoform X1 [Montipora capricornis]|uniref:RAB7A-interacting MON1-CCZ1 complex subunit 1-like isoform X1 n=2 Tax=Montipora capricornis TaxID=246305 RepID=UPI0035F10D30
MSNSKGFSLISEVADYFISLAHKYWCGKMSTGQDFGLAKKIAELQAECTQICKNMTDCVQLQLLEKAENKYKKCLSVLKTGQISTDRELAIQFFQEYSQALLDVTYVVECQLVNEDFPQDRSAEEIKHLIDRLDQPEQLVKEMFGSDMRAVDVLGIDLLECLSWRRGALFYMYCHTVVNDSERRRMNAVHIMECTVEGVRYLQSMLSVRSPLILEEYRDADIKDSDAVNLLKKGLFNDTHLLALMYAGEMCYWHWKICREGYKDVSSLQNRALNFDSLTNGTKLLQKFVNVVKTQLQGKGWDFSRAEQILAEFCDA